MQGEGQSIQGATDKNKRFLICADPRPWATAPIDYLKTHRSMLD
jgi:hypothetical protein